MRSPPPFRQHSPSNPTLSTSIRRLPTPSTSLDICNLPKWPPGSQPRHHTFGSLARSFPSTPGHPWTPWIPSALSRHNPALLTTPDSTWSPIWPIGPLSQHSELVSTTRSFSSHTGRSRYLGESHTSFPCDASPSTALNSTWSGIRPLRHLTRRSGFVPSTSLFPTPMEHSGTLGKSPSMSSLLPGSSAFPGAVFGESPSCDRSDCRRDLF